jgi:hypothetical protein
VGLLFIDPTTEVPFLMRIAWVINGPLAVRTGPHTSLSIPPVGFCWGIVADSEIICAVAARNPDERPHTCSYRSERCVGGVGRVCPVFRACRAPYLQVWTDNGRTNCWTRQRQFDQRPLAGTTPGSTLNQQQMKVLETRLKPFGSQRFWIIAETGEYAPQAEKWRFGQQLQQALVQAGWITSQKVRQRMGTAGFKKTTMYPYSRGGDNGLVIFAAPDSISAGTALNIVINEMSFGSSVETDDNLRNAILIFVGAQ